MSENDAIPWVEVSLLMNYDIWMEPEPETEDSFSLIQRMLRFPFFIK